MALKVKPATNEMKSISENIKPEIIFKKKKKIRACYCLQKSQQ